MVTINSTCWRAKATTFMVMPNIITNAQIYFFDKTEEVLIKYTQLNSYNIVIEQVAILYAQGIS